MIPGQLDPRTRLGLARTAQQNEKKESKTGSARPQERTQAVMAAKETRRWKEQDTASKSSGREKEREEEVEEHLVERSADSSDVMRVICGRTQTNPSGSICGHHANVGSENRWKRVQKERERDRQRVNIYRLVTTFGS